MWQLKGENIFLVALLLMITGCKSGKEMMLSSDLSGKDISDQLANLLGRARSGTVVKVPEGTYFFHQDLVVPSGVILAGEKDGRTHLRSRAGAVILLQNVSNAGVRDLELLGEEGHTGIEVRSGSPRKGIPSAEMKAIELINIGIDNVSFPANGKPRHGISVKTHGGRNITGVTITSCRVTGAHGVSSADGYDNCYIASYDAPGKGQVSNVLIEHCFFSRAGRQNLSIAGKGSSKPREVVIRNCTFDNSALGGIDLEEASAVLIENCRFTGSGKNEEYFLHRKETSSMRSGLVAHRSDAVVTNCTFTNCYYGYSSVNTQGEGIHFTECTFNDSPVSNGSFAGMAATNYRSCDFTGSLVLADMYAASFKFTDCTFTGGSPETMLLIGGGGLARRNEGEGSFRNCTFTGIGNTGITANYEDLTFTGCAFQNLQQILSASGNNRQNSFTFDDCSFVEVGTLGEIGSQVVEKLNVTNCRGNFTENLIRTPFKNGAFKFEGNDFYFPAGTTVFGKYDHLTFINNTLHPAAAPKISATGKQKSTSEVFLLINPEPGAATDIFGNRSSDTQIIINDR